MQYREMSVISREDVQGGRHSCEQMSLSTDQDPEKKICTVLLVGEGNFSFSASLCDISHELHHITTTCFEPEDTVSKQQLAWRNVQHLRNKGAVVYFGVDATKLHEYTFLANQLYDRIVFNFPHCGRKAGVKKNRDLLSNFFRSCADVLTPKGEIHVALCQGQGGTPADQPKREWHNSWQVVAMAASAGFILTSVVPFDTDKHNGYQNTGYRSQEKSFHVVGALNHVFTRGLPLENIRALQIIEKLMSGQETKCIDVEADRGFLGKASCHPISLLYKDLIKLCEQKMAVNVIEDTFSLTCHKDCLHHPPYLTSEANLYFVTPSKEEGALESSHRSLCFLEQDIQRAPNLGNTLIHPTMGQCHLRRSLTCFMEDLTLRSNLRPNLLTIVSGLVLRKCLISPMTMPVYHEILMLQDYQDHTLTVQLQRVMDSIRYAIETVSVSIISDSVNPLSRLSVTFHQVNEDYTITMIPSDCDQIIGTIKMVPPGNQYRELGILIVTLNLDLIAMCLLGIDDWRMLWTEDERFIEQFHPRDLKPFQSFSLYPPYYIHDVSFWVESSSRFDDVEFHAIALRISKGNIVDIQLLDRYENVETGKTGLCYRLKYQACDRALSYRSALTMQLRLRDELQRCLHVILR